LAHAQESSQAPCWACCVSSDRIASHCWCRIQVMNDARSRRRRCSRQPGASGRAGHLFP